MYSYLMDVTTFVCMQINTGIILFLMKLMTRVIELLRSARSKARVTIK